MGFAFAYAECFGCRRLFAFNPLRVPSIPGHLSGTGTREPICRDCVERVNPRTRYGLETAVGVQHLDSFRHRQARMVRDRLFDQLAIFALVRGQQPLSFLAAFRGLFGRFRVHDAHYVAIPGLCRKTGSAPDAYDPIEESELP